MSVPDENLAMTRPPTLPRVDSSARRTGFGSRTLPTRLADGTERVDRARVEADAAPVADPSRAAAGRAA